MATDSNKMRATRQLRTHRDPEGEAQAMKTEQERIQDLAAVIAGNMVGAAGYTAGRIIDPEEVAADAVAIAKEIIKATEER